MKDQSSSQNPGVGGMFSNPNLMLGLALMTAGNSKDPNAAIFNALNQAQQAQQLAAQQKMQQLQLAFDNARLGMDYTKLGLEQQKNAREEELRNTNLKQGQYFADNIVGQEPSAQNGWNPTGLLGDTSKMANNAALHNPNLPNQLKGSPFDVPEKLVQSTLDPVTKAKYLAAANIGRAGDPIKAADSLPEYPKPFSLSPGQQQFTPGGQLLAENIDKTKPITNAKDLRGEFINQSKPFVEIQSSYDRIQSVAKNPSAAGDLALIFNYMKMLDPGSTVREGEFANAQNAAGIPERARAMYNNALRGERLTEQTRADFLGQSNNLYQSALNNQNQLANQYTSFANQIGADPNLVIVNYRKNSKEDKSADNSVNLPAGEIPVLPENHPGFALRDKQGGLTPGTSFGLYKKKMFSQKGK